MLPEYSSPSLADRVPLRAPQGPLRPFHGEQHARHGGELIWGVDPAIPPIRIAPGETAESSYLPSDLRMQVDHRVRVFDLGSRGDDGPDCEYYAWVNARAAAQLFRVLDREVRWPENGALRVRLEWLQQYSVPKDRPDPSTNA